MHLKICELSLTSFILKLWNKRNSSRIATFMFCDFMSEEIDKTKRLSTENAYRMFKSNQPIKNQLFDPSKGFNMVE